MREVIERLVWMLVGGAAVGAGVILGLVDSPIRDLIRELPGVILEVL